MKLKAQKRQIYVVASNELDLLVKLTYGANWGSKTGWTFHNSHHAMNDSEHLFDVGPDILDDDEETKLRQIKEGYEVYYAAPAILTDLCNRGLIDAGEYLITVSW